MIDDAVVIPESLLDQTDEPSQSGRVISAQLWPRVPEDDTGVPELQQGFARHVTPASTMPCIDERVERRL